MAGVVLDGKAYAKELEAELTQRVARLMAATNSQGGGEPPILATILVGEDPALWLSSSSPGWSIHVLFIPKLNSTDSDPPDATSKITPAPKSPPI
ncbi:MAG: hypothetical protein WCC14_18305 [Acidobacteriaceae bacterium]